MRHQNQRFFNMAISYVIRIEQNLFLFQKNAEAKSGMFRVHKDGQYVLIDLADEHLRPLTPQP